MTEHLKNDTSVASEHSGGTIQSYVIGFVLSLVFTIIPYYLVTRQVLTGTTLLLLILGIAILQMLVQIFFFLHLGRGPKPLYNIVFFGATAGLIVLVVGASLLIMDNLYRNMSPQELTTRLAQEENIAELGGRQTGACQGNNASHAVIIKDGTVSPNRIVAKHCDTLVITNDDNMDRTFTFGLQESHDIAVSYGGVHEVPIKSSRYKSITLNEIGSFSFHDENDHLIMGYLTVEP